MDNCNWVTDITELIDKETKIMNEKDLKKYQIDILKKVAVRIDEFDKEGCDLCEEYKVSFSELISMLITASYKEYKTKLSIILKHIRTEHQLYTEKKNK